MSDVPLSKPSGLTGSTSLAWGRPSAAAKIGLPVATAAAIAAPAASQGAYFPTAWGWMAIAFAWAAVLTIVLRGVVPLGWFEWTMLGGLIGLTAWIALSALWSSDVSQTALEVERALVYVSAVLVAMLLVRRSSVTQLLAGVLVAISGVSAYSLATRLFPERLAKFDEFAVNRLQQPLGYWNSLGTFVAIGLLLALGFAAHARPLWGRAAAAAAVPILLTTLYFTFGRGAWVALAAGLLAAVALDPRRLELITAVLVVVPFSAAAVWLASRSEALTSRAPPLSEAAEQGRALVPVVVGLAAASGCAALVLAAVERRLPPLPRARIAYGAVLLAGAIACLAWVFAVYGAPWTIAERGYRQFVDAPPATWPVGGEQADLNQRLFTLWGNNRPDLWRVAWDVAREHPWVGSGAGTYEQHWLRDRPFDIDVRDAHSLYVETLAELGPPGLLLLVVALGTPLVAALRARRRRLVGAATGAYVVYLVHAAADWDWEMTAVTMTALVCGVALVAAARANDAVARAVPLIRATVAVGAVAIVALSTVALLGNHAVAESGRAAATLDWTRAEAEARKAIRWAPWSAHGWQALAEAQLMQLKFREAQASFRHALEKDPHDWSLWLNLAYASKGSAQRRAAERALALNPTSSEIARVRPAIGLPPSDG